MENQEQSRRLKIMKIAPIILKKIFEEGNIFERTKVIDGLPEDAEIIGAVFNNIDRNIEFVVRSETFDEVPSASLIPDMKAIILERLD